MIAPRPRFPPIVLVLASMLGGAALHVSPAEAQSTPATPATPATGNGQATKPPAQAPSAEAQAAAREHFQKAKSLYQTGAYREAIVELEAALQLDPNATDLVFNLGVVHEKLGDIDEALRWFRRYEQMDLDPQQRARADAFIRRLQGAKREVKEDKPPPSPSPAAPPAHDRPPPAHGRVDALTITAAVIGVAGLAVGGVFGAKALIDNPKIPATWSSPDEQAAAQRQATNAHREAVVSDIGWGVGAAGVVAAAVLFFARTREPARASSGAAPREGLVGVSIAPARGGGGLVVVGSF